MQLEENIASAINWLLHSGIQAESGAFNAWFDLDEKSYPFAYSEITGYAMTALLFFNRMEKQKGLMQRAEKAALWLHNNALSKEGAVRTRQYYDAKQADESFSFEGGNVFAFDCGMVLNGFVNLFNETKKKEYLNYAEKIASFLDEKMFANEMHAVYNLKSKRFLDNPGKWSWQPGSYHAKAAIGLLDIAAITENGDFAGKAGQLCENAVELQHKSGRFITSKSDNSTHLHPHCYSAEGLLYAGIKLKEEKFVAAAEKATEWALLNQASNGGVNAFFGGKWNSSQRSDVIAQVLRLAAALKSIGRLQSIADEKIGALCKRLLSFQNMKAGEQQGGFFYGQELDGGNKNCLNSWCTMFAAQAMQWQGKLQRKERFEIELTI